MAKLRIQHSSIQDLSSVINIVLSSHPLPKAGDGRLQGKLHMTFMNLRPKAKQGETAHDIHEFEAYGKARLVHITLIKFILPL